MSSTAYILCSVLGPRLFILYTDDLADSQRATCNNPFIYRQHAVVVAMKRHQSLTDFNGASLTLTTECLQTGWNSTWIRGSGLVEALSLSLSLSRWRTAVFDLYSSKQTLSKSACQSVGDLELSPRRVDYCNVVFAGAPKTITNNLQRVLNRTRQLVWSVAPVSLTAVWRIHARASLARRTWARQV